jgi:hypothetical protein
VKPRFISRFGGLLAAAAAPAVFVIAGACTTANMTDYTPVNEQTKFSEDALYRGARDAAEHLDLRVQAGEGGTSFDTREKQVATSSIPRLSYKFSFHVETSGGMLVIKANCVKNSTTSESEFSDCGDDRPAKVVELQAALRKQALERAKANESNSADFGHFGEPEEAPDAGKGAGKDEEKASASSKSDKKAEDKKAEDKKSDSKDSEKGDSSKGTGKSSAKKK